jgi:predicted dienelactone hydrolase
MKRLLFALAVLTPIPSASAAELPGLMVREIAAPHHGRTMDMAIWYPGEGGVETIFAENPVFKGGTVREDAKPMPGKHPIVLLSHGLGGNLRSLAWLATGLVERGAVVIAVNHPNSSFKDMNTSAAFNHWTRVQDLETALDNVLQDTSFAGKLDISRIYAAGFSYGGWTALSMAGVTGRPEGSVAYCKAAGERSTHCMDLKKAGVDLTKLDGKLWTASYRDKRIRAVAAIDPGLSWGLDPTDVKNVEQDKLLLIGLGAGADRLYATDTSAAGNNFESLVPSAKVEVLAPASHFTAMPICKPEGPAILAEEKDDAVCTDPAGSDRKDVHDKIIELIAKHFEFD